MKILSAQSIKRVDAYTIENEPIASIDLMERAAGEAFKWIREFLYRRRWARGGASMIYLFCGPGNNGGDGFSVGRRLLADGFPVRAFLFASGRMSDDCIQQMEWFIKYGGQVTRVNNEDALAALNIEGDGVPFLVIDALFGTGLSRPLEGIHAFAVKMINSIRSKGATCISIDVPSGLFCDDNSMNSGPVVEADYTLTFQLPRLAFMLPWSGRYAGNVIILPIGLSQKAIDAEETRYFYFTEEDAIPFIKGRPLWSHKRSYGHALLVGGSAGKGGAIIMAGRGALLSGCGLVTAAIPGCLLESFQTRLPEAMTFPDECYSHITEVPRLDGFSAVGVGPGMGVNEDTRRVLKELIQRCEIPLIMDADALNILAEEKTWLAYLPPETILTPHTGEFRRLFGDFRTDEEALEKQVDASVRYNLIIIHKRYHSAVSFPDGTVWFIGRGGPVLARGGTGDILLGLITGLVARGYSRREASLLGPLLHGIAGDIAGEVVGSEAITSLEIASFLPDAWKVITNMTPS